MRSKCNIHIFISSFYKRGTILKSLIGFRIGHEMFDQSTGTTVELSDENYPDR